MIVQAVILQLVITAVDIILILRGAYQVLIMTSCCQ